MKIALEKAEPHNLGIWHVHVDGKHIGKYVPKDWQMIEENAISLELRRPGGGCSHLRRLFQDNASMDGRERPR